MHDALGVKAASLVVLFLMVAQSAIGLLVPSVYRDPLWILWAWKGNDIVTLAIVAPMLGLSIARGSSPRSRIVWLGSLAYDVYNYAYYLFGATLNALFPLYVALFVGSILALVLVLAKTDRAAIRDSFRPSTPRRIIAGTLTATGLALCAVWLSQWAGLVFMGKSIDVGPEVARLIAALDLSIMVPSLVAGGVLLWRKNDWGWVLAPMASILSATYMLVLTVSSLLSARASIPGAAAQVPLWAALMTMLALVSAVLVRNAAPRGSPVVPGRPVALV